MVWCLIDIFPKLKEIQGQKKAIINLIISIAIVVIIIPTISILSIVGVIKGGKYFLTSVSAPNQTNKEIEQITVQLEKHHAYYNTYPDNYYAFVSKKPIWAPYKKDSWGNSYQYTGDSTSFKLTSAGKDGVFNTEDDIVKRSAE